MPRATALQLRRHFAGSVARDRAADPLALCADWRPEIVVRDEADFGAAVIAERLKEIAAQPPPAHAVELLERLALTRRQVLRPADVPLELR